MEDANGNLIVNNEGGTKAVERAGLAAVRAYFKCNSRETKVFGPVPPYKPQHKVTFGAMHGDRTGSLSKDYCDATPVGEIWMNITDGYPAADFFKPGKNYFITFTEAPD